MDLGHEAQMWKRDDYAASFFVGILNIEADKAFKKIMVIVGFTFLRPVVHIANNVTWPMVSVSHTPHPPHASLYLPSPNSFRFFLIKSLLYITIVLDIVSISILQLIKLTTWLAFQCFCIMLLFTIYYLC